VILMCLWWLLLSRLRWSTHVVIHIRMIVVIVVRHDNRFSTEVYMAVW